MTFDKQSNGLGTAIKSKSHRSRNHRIRYRAANCRHGDKRRPVAPYAVDRNFAISTFEFRQGKKVRSRYRSLHCALASCGAVCCNRSCLWVCGSGGAVGVRTLLQPARSVCVSLSAFSFICAFVCSKNDTKSTSLFLCSRVDRISKSARKRYRFRTFTPRKMVPMAEGSKFWAPHYTLTPFGVQLRNMVGYFLGIECPQE